MRKPSDPRDLIEQGRSQGWGPGGPCPLPDFADIGEGQMENLLLAAPQIFGADYSPEVQLLAQYS